MLHGCQRELEALEKLVYKGEVVAEPPDAPFAFLDKGVLKGHCYCGHVTVSPMRGPQSSFAGPRRPSVSLVAALSVERFLFRLSSPNVADRGRRSAPPVCYLPLHGVSELDGRAGAGGHAL